VRITDFDDNGISNDNEFMTAESYDSRHMLEVGDIIFARSGATVGKTYLYEGDIGAAVFAGYCIRFRFDPNKALPKFIYYTTKTDRYNAWVKSIQRPSGQPNINKEEFKSFTIPLPSFEVQRKLVDEIEAARDKRQRKLAEADELLNSLDSWLLAQLGLEPPPVKNRKVFAVRLSDLSSERLDAFYYSPHFLKVEQQLRSLSTKIVSLGSQLMIPPLNGVDARKYQSDGQKYLRVQNVRPFEIDNSDAKFVAVEYTKDVALKAGDVLLTRKGTFGVAAPVAKEHEGDLISSEIILLRLSEQSELKSDFLVGWLNSSYAQTLLNRYKTGGIMGHITQDVVSAFPIPCPDLETQRMIVKEILRRRAEAQRLQHEAETEWQQAKKHFEEQLLTGDAA
jgi:type I restriction enzyme, S subunit